MTTRQVILAKMITYVDTRAKAANLRGALDALKDDIGAWLDEHPDEPELLDPGTEIRAFWRDVSGGQVLNVAALDDATLRWAADQGLLEGNMKKIDACKYTAPELVALHQNTSPAPGYRTLQVVPPSYQRRQELAEQAAEQAAQQPAPLHTAPAQPEPAEPPAQHPARPRAVPAPVDPAGEVCPVHGRARYSEKSGGFFCPTREGEGWCQWTTARKAS